MPNPQHQHAARPPRPQDLVTPQVAARVVGCHVSSIYRWVQTGRLRGYRVAGCRYLLSRADLEDVVQEVVPRRGA